MTNLPVVDAVDKVKITAKPTNYGITHVSWSELPSTLNWLNLYLVRSTTGYPQSPSDGVQIYSTATNDVIFNVTAITASSGGAISTVSVDYAGISATSTCPSGTKANAIQMLSTSNVKSSRGQGATLHNNTAGGSFTIDSSGSGFSVNDKIKISQSSFTDGVSSTTQLGVKNVYHIYDNGSSVASETNEGYQQLGADLGASKYYYSLFVSYYDTNNGVASTPSMSNYKYLKWKKIGESSSDVVHTNRATDANGAVLVKGTKDIIFEHLPIFYTKKLDGTFNQDLDDFISLFAFNMDLYIQKNKTVFNATDVNVSDELLLARVLNQFGSQYSGTSNLTQARVLAKNIIKAFKLNGSSIGISNYLESYSGYPIKALPPKNFLFDYNTSSFVEGTGMWYPDPAASNSAAYLPAAQGYAYSLGPSNNAVANIGVLEIGTATGGAYLATSNYVEPYSNILDPYYAYDDDQGTRFNLLLTNCQGSGTLITCDDTSKLLQGAKLTIVSGPGKFALNTVVTKVNSPTTFTINVAPAVALSNTSAESIANVSKIAVANNLTSPMMKITPSTSPATVTFYSGVRKSVTTQTYSAKAITIGGGTTTPLRPFVAKVGDFVTGHSSIPVNTYITKISSKVLTLSNPLTADLPSGTTIYFTKPTSVTHNSSLNIEGGSTNLRSDSVVDSYPVSPNTPYGFVIHFNANGNNTVDTAAKLQWYDASGTLISTSSATATAPTNTEPVTNYNFKNTWYPSFVCDVSPSNAAFVQPVFSLTNVTTGSSGGYFADAAMLIAPTSIVKASKTSGTVTITTKTPHNFLSGEKVAVYTSDTTSNKFNTPTGTPAEITAVSQNAKKKLYTFSYVLGSGSVSATDVTGYCASLPAVDITYTAAYPVTAATGNGTTTRYTCANPGTPISPGLVGQTATVYNISRATGTGTYSGSFAIANANATYIDLTNNANGTGAVTSSSIIVLPTTTTRSTVFEDARVNRLEIKANRVNLCPNPNFESSTLGWGKLPVASGSVVRDSSTYYTSSQCGKITISANAEANTAGMVYSSASTGNPAIMVNGASGNKVINVNGKEVTVSASNYYSFSAYVKSTEAGSFQVQVKWFDNTDTQIGSTVTGTNTPIDANEWFRVSLSQAVNGEVAKAPAGAVYAYMYVIKTTLTGVSDTTMYLDSILVEKSLTVNSYFDGGFDGYSHETTRNSMWESSENGSQSHLYNNRLTGQAFIDTRATDMIYYG